MSKFEKGTSGNPNGRPPKELTAQKLRALITEQDVSDILSAMVAQAKAGDIQAAKLILDKVLPSLKTVEIEVDARQDNTPIVYRYEIID